MTNSFHIDNPGPLSLAEISERLKVDPEVGLSSSEHSKRFDKFGPNELQVKVPVSRFQLFIKQFADLMVLILLVAASVALLSWWVDGRHGIPADGIVILLIVFANALLGCTQEYKAERIIQELQASTRSRAKALRDGQTKEIDQSKLVVGDVILLHEGDLVPADLVLVSASHLRADESLLTGESVPVSKSPQVLEGERVLSERSRELFAGTMITAGVAKALVTKTGINTELGRIATSLETTTAVRTPLENRLEVLGKQIGLGVLLLSVLIAIVVLWVEGNTDSSTLLRVGMFAVALAVAAVPEGLPAVLTVSLSAGAKRLAQRNVMCRKMSAVETLGSVTTIVTDKTGTLTQNQMTVRKLVVNDRTVEVSGDGYESDGHLSDTSEVVLELVRCGIMASQADFEKDKKGVRRAIGDPMDAALLVLAEKAKLDWKSCQSGSPKLQEIPFSSDRARVSVLRETKAGPVLFVKGSLQAILALCSQAELETSLGAGALKALADIEQKFGDEALRTLAFARRAIDHDEADILELEKDLTFLGLIAFEDPPRPDVRNSVELCRKSGMKVIMCTGDHPTTATAVARKVGLIDQDQNDSKAVLTGPEFAEISDVDFRARSQHLAVCARFTPDQKLALVDRLINQGEILAMTGDGVNDAPALKKVHVGVAMGRSGTAVAVEASELVLTDDNFSSIVAAIQEGRSVYLNIQRFIAFLFSGNFGVVLAIFAGTMLAGFFDLRYEGLILLPLTAAQILWMNLVTDGAPALAFALGEGSEEVMDDPPREPTGPILCFQTWLLVALTGSVLAGLFLLLLDSFYAGGIWTARSWDPIYVQSLAFYALVSARLANAFNFLDLNGAISIGSIRRNPFLIAAVFLSWILTVAVVQIPSFGVLFGLKSLHLNHLIFATLALPPLVMVSGNVMKWILRRIKAR